MLYCFFQTTKKKSKAGERLAVTTTEAEHQVEGGFLLDVVVSQGATVLKLLSSEDKSLLVWWDAFLILDLLLDVLNGISRFNVKGDGLSSQGLDEDLHASTETKDQVKGGFLLDVIVSKGATILELLSGEDESLLVWGDSFLVLNLLLDVLNGISRLDIEGNGLSSQSLDEDLHASSKAEHQVKGGFLLDVVVRKGATILELLSGEDESLLVWGNTFLVLNLLLHVLDGISRLNVKGNGLSS